jgi:TRAP-type C4-dicarboxylate transport system permease small subunit
MKESFHRFVDAVYLACIWIAGGSVFFMTLIIPWGIFTRYVLGYGSQWPEPVSILLMVVFTFIGAAAGTRAGTHIAVEMLTERMPAALKHFSGIAVSALLILLSLFMTVWGFKLCIGTMGQSVPDLPWMAVGVTYLPVPIGGLATLLFVVERALFGPQNRRRIVAYDEALAHVEGAQ